MAENQPNVTHNRKSGFIDEDKNTELHYAAACGHIDNVKELLQSRHEIDPVNYLDWTPLMMATRYGHTEVIKMLLEKHADSTRTNRYGFNVLLMAVACGKFDVLQLILYHLLCGGVSKQSMQRLFSPISLAVLFNNVHVVQYLIEKGFCINAATVVTGITPQAFAAAMGNADVINLLSKKGGNSNRQTTPVEKHMLTTLHAKQDTAIKHVLNPPPPLVVVSGSSLTPQPAFLNVTPNLQMPRRCSELVSPYFTPHLSPLPPGAVVHQIFFPTNFSPGQFVSPVAAVPMPHSYEFLNARIMQQSPYYAQEPFHAAY